MSEKELSKLMIDKLKQRADYFAWYFFQFEQSEKVQSADVAKLLEATSDQLEILSMCKVPDSRQSDFQQRLRGIADFAHVNIFQLAMLVRKVEASVALQEDKSMETAALIAAREMDNSARQLDNKK